MNRAARLESTCIRLGLVALTVITTTCVFWTAGFLLWKAHLIATDEPIVTLTLTGLVVGLAAGAAVQARVAQRFYLLGWWALVPGYLPLWAFTIALGMGLPVALPVLGVLVGVYVARRAALQRLSKPAFHALLRRTALLTAGCSFVLLAGLWSLSALRAVRGLPTGVPDFAGSPFWSHLFFLAAAVVAAPAVQWALAVLTARWLFAHKAC